MKKTVIFFAFISITTFLTVKAQTVKIKMETDWGSIIAELYSDKAPVTCANFIKYTQNNKLEGANFYRVVRMDNQPNNEIKIEVIQGGLGFDVEEPPYPPIMHETTKETGVLHEDGTLSMARLQPGTASSEFFICIGEQPELDFGGNRNPDGQGFAAFGKIIEGMDVVRKIQQMADHEQMLIEIVKINSVHILE